MQIFLKARTLGYNNIRSPHHAGAQHAKGETKGAMRDSNRAVDRGGNRGCRTSLRGCPGGGPSNPIAPARAQDQPSPFDFSSWRRSRIAARSSAVNPLGVLSGRGGALGGLPGSVLCRCHDRFPQRPPVICAQRSRNGLESPPRPSNIWKQCSPNVVAVP